MIDKFVPELKGTGFSGYMAQERSPRGAGAL